MKQPDMFGHSAKPNPRGGLLAQAFILPPFTVLNAREGWWQERKRAWLALGIKSELGRGADLAAMGGAIERREAIGRGGVGANTPYTGSGMADGLVALRAAEKARREGR